MGFFYFFYFFYFFFQAEDGIRDWSVTGVQTCALPISFCEPRRLQNVTMHYPLMVFLKAGAELPNLIPQVSQGEVTDVGWFPLEKAQIGRASCRERV